MSVRLYSSLRMCLRLVAGVFFRQVEVVGLEHVPESGPVIFAGNHPSSLIDPLRVFDRAASVRRGLSTLVRLLAFDREIRALRDERAALETAVVGGVNRSHPADMVLLFPRDPEPASR